jgi:hypothetical protein
MLLAGERRVAISLIDLDEIEKIRIRAGYQ